MKSLALHRERFIFPFCKDENTLGALSVKCKRSQEWWTTFSWNFKILSPNRPPKWKASVLDYFVLSTSQPTQRAHRVSMKWIPPLIQHNMRCFLDILKWSHHPTYSFKERILSAPTLFAPNQLIWCLVLKCSPIYFCDEITTFRDLRSATEAEFEHREGLVDAWFSRLHTEVTAIGNRKWQSRCFPFDLMPRY